MAKILVSATETGTKRAQFIHFVFDGTDDGYVCIARRVPDGKFEERFFHWPAQEGLILGYIDEHILERNIWFCPMLFATAVRTKYNVKTCPTVWSDLDTCPPESLLVPPTLLVETSPGRHQGLWCLQELIDPSEAEDLSKAIAYYHSQEGADKSGWDLTQLLRVPYTLNFKYDPPATIYIANAGAAVSVEVLRERYPLNQQDQELTWPLPNRIADGEKLLQGYSDLLDSKVWQLLKVRPEQDWSKSLWKLEMLLAESGLSREDIFAIVKTAACNKYARDGRNELLLWKEVCKAWVKHRENSLIIQDVRAFKNPDLLSDEDLKSVEADRTFIDDYIDWAKSVGDAAEVYHHAGAFVCLSALMSGSVQLPTSFGTIIPNLWFLLLADCLPVETPVLTPSGWVKMKDIQVGDAVIGSSGRAVGVTHKSVTKHLDSYLVTFKDGTQVECSGDHLWTVTIKPDPRTVTVPLLKVKEYLDKGRNPRVPIVSKPVVYDTTPDLPVNPYLLGIWLADGCRAPQGYDARIVSYDPALVELIRSSLPENLKLSTSNYTDWRIVSKVPYARGNSVLYGLKRLGLLALRSSQRFVPEVYKFASVEDRISLIQGYMDGDGWPQPGQSNARASSCSEQLIYDMADVMRSIGGYVRVTSKAAPQVSTGRMWTLNLAPPPGLIPFRLERKAEHVRASRVTRRAIRSIEPIGAFKAMQCIKVDAADGLYVVDNFTVTHNTTLTRKSTALDLAVDMLVELDPDLIMATDGSIEGMFSALSLRPGQPSVFLRDEFSGLIEMMNKKDYYAGMGETLTKMYDGKMQKRVLRRETIIVNDPVLIVFAGGIRTKILSLLNPEHVTSGFIPRFILISGQSQIDRLQPLGPPVEKASTGRNALMRKLMVYKTKYRKESTVRVSGVELKTTNRQRITLTPDAWVLYNDMERKLLETGIKDTALELLTPIMDRLAKSGLKAAMLIAASRMNDPVVVEERDIAKAFSYVIGWRQFSMDVIASVGLPHLERTITNVYNIIQANPGIMRSRVMNQFHLTNRDAELVLETLEQRGRIERIKRGKSEALTAIDE